MSETKERRKISIDDFVYQIVFDDDKLPRIKRRRINSISRHGIGYSVDIKFTEPSKDVLSSNEESYINYEYKDVGINVGEHISYHTQHGGSNIYFLSLAEAEAGLKKHIATVTNAMKTKIAHFQSLIEKVESDSYSHII